VNGPAHVGIIMDGNGRWAVAKGLPRFEGHKQGIGAVKKVLTKAKDLGIQWLTLYSFSTENWKRPLAEVRFLFSLMEEALVKEEEHLQREQVRVRILGSREGIPERFQKTASAIVERTAENKGITLVFAINYGGRKEILDAIRNLMAKNPREDFRLEDYMYMPDLPEVDLIIRTAGEERISNFLLWHSAYAEFYFTKVLWPDFNENSLEEACREYSRRKRRFGGLG
jgi:undecaprenyl diphosphate synthase